MKKPLPAIATLPVMQFLQTEDGQPFDIPPSGSIGLLALGDLGIIAWRQKLQQIKTEMAERTRRNLMMNDE